MEGIDREGSGTTTALAPAGERSPVVDCHVHALQPSVIRAFRRWLTETGTMEEGPPLLWSSPDFDDPARQVESLNRAGIDAGIVTYSSNTPAALHASAVSEGLSGPERIRRTNAELREWEGVSGGRLLANSWVDPRLIDSALEEIERAASATTGTRAVSVLTAYAGVDGTLRFLDHPDFEPVLALAAERNVPLFVHGSTKYDLSRVGEPPLPGMAGVCVTGGLSMLVENTLCLVRLVLSGTFDRHPGLSLVLGQLGGVFPFIVGRFDLIRTLLSGAEAAAGQEPASSGRSEGVLRSLSDYAERVYVDTHSMSGPALACALEVLGPRRVVFGSDFPVTPERFGRVEGIATIRGLGLGSDDRDAILGGTAADLLGISEGAVAK